MAIITSDGVPISSDVYTYGNLSNAAIYFATRLNASAWTNATDDDKLKALATATRAIDKLNFLGCKADKNQELQFPRGDDTAVPLDVESACYEEALSLLNGADIAIEKANLNVVSHGLSSARTVYDRSFAPAHILAGLTSESAWSYLRPYLRDPNTVIINRE